METLKTIFKRFDVECLKANLFRVRIVGDGYVVWGVNEQTALRNPGKEAKDCIELGMRMIKIVEEVCEFKAKNVGVRIGIHTGRITGGIAVADHLKYELYGPEVMVAQEMERRGMRNAVQVSEATKAVLNEDEARFYKFRQYSVVRVN